MTLIEAAKLALEHGEFPQGSGIIRELRQAIAKAEQQEPVAWLTGCPECGMDGGCGCGNGIKEKNT